MHRSTSGSRMVPWWAQAFRRGAPDGQPGQRHRMGSRRSRTQGGLGAVATALILIVGLVGIPTSASAESVTGEAEDLTPCPPNQSEYYCLGYGAGFCAFNAAYCTGYAAGGAAGSSLNIALDEFNHGLELTLHGIRRTFATDVNDRLEVVAGEVLAQVERLTGLRAWYDVGSGPSASVGVAYNGIYMYETVYVDPDCLPPFCWPVTGYSRDSGGDSVSKFAWNNNAIRTWDPDTQECRCADGRAVWNLYRATEQPRIEFEFFATSQKSSVRARNGKKLEGVLQWIGPFEEDSEELVDWDPISIDEYGDAGSLSLGASLSTERVGSGASFSIGRTWNFSKGQVGGTASHAGDHILGWWETSGSTAFARGVQGVETWKVPTETDASWLIGAEAHVD